MGILNSFTEKDLETMIMDNRSIISERGLSIFYKNTDRQVKVPLGGIIDIFTWEISENTLFARVIELKKDEISMVALVQALDYYECVSYNRMLFDKVSIEIILIGSVIKDDLKFLKNMEIPNLSLYTYDFGFNGLFFTLYQSENITKNNGLEGLKTELSSTYEQFMGFYEKLTR